MYNARNGWGGVTLQRSMKVLQMDQNLAHTSPETEGWAACVKIKFVSCEMLHAVEKMNMKYQFFVYALCISGLIHFRSGRCESSAVNMSLNHP